MSVNKRSGLKTTRWYYYFRIRGIRYRGSIPEARTKWEAEQAESKIRQEVYEGRFGKTGATKTQFSTFLNDTYLPWAKVNKRSWRNDHYAAPILLRYFGAKNLCQITPQQVENFKGQLAVSTTQRGLQRSPASVNRHLEMVSRIFNLAIAFGIADTNPCSKVPKFKLDNQRYRYLLPEEEPRLMAVLTDRRAHLAPMVVIAIGTGLRLREMLGLRRDQVDFARNVVTAARTKTRRNREIPMNSDVLAVLTVLCEGKQGNDYLFPNPKTGTSVNGVRTAFGTACRLAGIEGLVWHDLRATFGTRLGEAGFDAFTIAELMGHTDVRTTRRYVRATERNKREAVNAAKLQFNANVHTLATNRKRPPVMATVSA
jgi:integrase